MLIVYIDTNILMEHEPLDQLPLDRIMGGTVDRVVIPHQVLKEIDKHKYSHDKRLRRRAEQAAARIAGWRRTGSLSSGIEVGTARAKAFDYAAHDLDRESQDERIIATMIQQSEALPEDTHALLTADQHLIVLADEYELQHALMTDHRLKAEESSPTGGPRPTLMFSDGKSFAEYVVPLPPDLPELESAALEKYWTPTHPATPTGEAANIKTIAALSALSTINLPGRWPTSEKQVRKHAADLDRYARTTLSAVDLSLLIGNDGTLPADDVDVFLEFDSATCTPTAEGDLPDYPVDRDPYGINTRMALLHPRGTREFFGPWINATGDGVNTVRYHAKRVKHGMRRRLDPLYLLIPDTEQPKSFGFRYSIHSANSAKPAEGELHVKLTSGERLTFADIEAHEDDE